MPLLAYVGSFSEQLEFWKTHFFKVSIPSEQLLLQKSQLNTTVTFAKQLFLHSCYLFFRSVASSQQLLFSEYQLFWSNTSTEQLLIENTQSFRQLLFRRTILLIIMIEELLFRSRYFYTEFGIFELENRAKKPLRGNIPSQYL